MTELSIGERTFRVNPHGLEGTIDRVTEVATDVLTRITEEQPSILNRCTFFAYRGHPYLESHSVDDPRIEGYDKNPFDQHYWLAFDLMKAKNILIDPIFNYIGVQDFANDFLDQDQVGYYQRKRVVPHDKPQWEGGVRIKTMGI